jgi:hypothetical protein
MRLGPEFAAWGSRPKVVLSIRKVSKPNAVPNCQPVSIQERHVAGVCFLQEVRGARDHNSEQALKARGWGRMFSSGIGALNVIPPSGGCAIRHRAPWVRGGWRGCWRTTARRAVNRKRVGGWWA